MMNSYSRHSILFLLLLAQMSTQCCQAWMPPSSSSTKSLFLSTQLRAATKAKQSRTVLRFRNETSSGEDPALSTSTPGVTATSSLVKSVNFFISRKCNYSCKFCFHTQKTSHHLTVEQAKLGLKLLRDAGTEKINFAGGEPFLQPHLLGELCRVSHEQLGLAVSIISNGSLITQEWMEEYGKFVDVLGISVDSFDDATNFAIGRGETESSTTAKASPTMMDTTKQNKHVDRVLRVRELCRDHDIIFKLNTVVCSLNWEEDMNEQIRQLAPQRWKVFQVLLLKDENMGQDGNLRDARSLVVSREQFDAFVQRHSTISELIAEPNDVMQNSYLLLDEDMRFLDCSQGGKVPGESILKVGVSKALQQAGFDHSMFQQRGGIYDWKRERASD